MPYTDDDLRKQSSNLKEDMKRLAVWWRPMRAEALEFASIHDWAIVHVGDATCVGRHTWGPHGQGHGHVLTSCVHWIGSVEGGRIIRGEEGRGTMTEAERYAIDNAPRRAAAVARQRANAAALSASLTAALAPSPVPISGPVRTAQSPTRVRNRVTGVRKNHRQVEADPPPIPPDIDNERKWLLHLVGAMEA